jgi:hypothetical protein
MRLALVALLIGCGGAGDTPPPSTPAGQLTATCDKGHDAVGPACVPRFDACEGLPLLGGGCETIEVVAPTIPTTFECREQRAGSIAISGSIAAAVAAAAPGASLWIPDGTYDEDVVIDKPIALQGACPARVRVRGIAAKAAIEIRAAVTLTGISITGPARGITVDGGKKVLLAELRIHDVGDLGIGARNDSEVDAAAVLVENAVDAGIAAAGGKLRLGGVTVRRVRKGSGALAGDGVYIGADPVTRAAGTLGATGVAVEEVAGGGIAVLGALIDVQKVSIKKAAAYGIGIPIFSSTTASSIWIKTARIEASGPGVIASKTLLTLDHVTIDHSREKGIAITDAPLTVDAVTVRGTELQNGSGCGLCAVNAKVDGKRLIVADNAAGGIAATSSTLDLAQVLSARNGTLGISLANGATALRETVVRDTKPRADGSRGDGILVAYQPGQTATLTLTDALVERNRNIGVAVFGVARIERTIVRDTTPRPGSTYAFGIVGIPPSRDPKPSKLTLADVLVERNVAAGLFLGQSAAEITASVFRETRGDSAGAFGDGIALTAGYGDPANKIVVPSSATIARTVSERNARAGISVMGSNLALTSSRLRCNAVDLDIEQTFDTDTGATNPVGVEDRGGNDCSCDPVKSLACRAQTTGLLPVQAAE